jgi:aromatic ring-opening dioxygenase LigB subunit
VLSSVLMLPHGAEIVPAPYVTYNEAFRPLHDAMRVVGQDVASRQTKLVLMLTPHGYSLDHAYAVYLHERLQGLFYTLSESNIFGEIAERMLWPGDRVQAERLLATMQASGIAAEGLTHGSPSYPLALAWGESVPLRYLAAENGPSFVIIGLPRSRHDRLPAMQGDLAALGRILYDLASSFDGSVSIVSSADLSHTHSAEGPYGFHPTSKVFDETVQRWASKPERAHLERMLAMQPEAKACGMAGMCVLQSVLDQARFSSRRLIYALPTYYGMAVAEWA